MTLMFHSPRIELFVMLTAISASSVAFAQTSGTDETLARNRWIEGYRFMEDAEEINGKNNESAIELYHRAQAVFLAVQNEFPLWNADVIAFRISYCDKKVDFARGRRCKVTG